MTGPIDSSLRCFPELKYYLDKIHFVYASAHSDHNIIYRDTLEIVNDIREARKNGKKKILFFNGSETFLVDMTEKIQRIAEILKEIPTQDLLFMVGVPDADKLYEKKCKDNNWEKRLTVFGSHFFEQVIWHYAVHEPDLDVEYEIKPKEKLFVCFNKVHRHHRIELLAQAISNGWLDKSFYSFEGAWPLWYTDPNISQRSRMLIQQIKDKLPLRLNITDQRPNPVNLETDDLIYHQESYFSIVTETIFYKPNVHCMSLLKYEDTLFLSEKIYKPFAFKHPFIVFAYPGALKVLRDRGFKTFSPYIDESYDLETDDDKRFEMLIAEIKRMEKFTTEEWLIWQRNIKPLVEYNYKYLLSLTDHRDGPPIDYLFND